MDTPPFITLTTDFGTEDPYVGMMKGVILGINPRASIVDISHYVQPQSIVSGAFIIGVGHRFFPSGTVHIVVVDPGVGSSRKLLLLETPRATFLAPDNGVLSRVLGEGTREPGPTEAGRASLPTGYRAFSLTNPEFWLYPVSNTFHGRDIFAPVAAHLSLGVPPQRLGEEERDIAWLPHSEPRWEGEVLEGRVVHVDHFGNLITDIAGGLLEPWDGLEVEVAGQRITGLSRYYQERERLLAIVGSYGTLEVSIRDGSAGWELGLWAGEPVKVRRRGPNPPS